jgi:KaiC/GvpD/RAD55 family RecA-like ATPase
MGASTGAARLDAVLGGGLPERRATVVAGGPGLGKTTLALQFLDAGLDAGETGLFLSTEQRPDELEASFDGFAFDLPHDDLTIASLRPRGDGTLETAVRGGDAVRPGLDGFSMPVDFQQVADAVESLGPVDRVAFDSVSGLGTIDDDPGVVRRFVLDLIRVFSDRFGATTLLTAEDEGDADHPAAFPLTRAVEFAANGAVRLERADVRGTRRRLLRVAKLRGVDHPSRPFEYAVDERGVRLLGPWLDPPDRTAEWVVETGVTSLDAFAGGGLVTGDSIVVEHDERALVGPLVVQMASGAVDAGMALWLIPAPVLTASRFDDLLPPSQAPVADLLESDRLFVLDLFSGWSRFHGSPNVYTVPRGRFLRGLVSTSWGLGYAKRVIKGIHRQRDDRPVFAPVYTDAFTYLFDDLDEVRELYYWARDAITTERDTALYVHNPHTIDHQLAAALRSEARQVFDLSTGDAGLQYLQLEKSPIGSSGEVAVVDYAAADGTLSLA